MTPRLWKEVGLISLLGAVVFFGLAIFKFHGGSYSTAESFSWTSSFISDLGNTRTLNGDAQPLVRLFFGIAFFLTSIMMICTVFWKTSLQLPTRRDHIARDLVILQAVSFFLIVFFPSDIHRTIHRSLLGVVVILSAIIWPICFDDIHFASHSTRLITYLTTLAIWAYLAFILIAPRPETSIDISNLHAQLEKAVFVLVFVDIYSLFTDRVKTTEVKKHKHGR